MPLRWALTATAAIPTVGAAALVYSGGSLSDALVGVFTGLAIAAGVVSLTFLVAAVLPLGRLKLPLSRQRVDGG